MPSPRRNGKRGKDKPIVIIFPGSHFGYLGGMSMSGEEDRCIKFANEKEARTWILNQQMIMDQYDAHMCIDILRHIDKGEKVIRCNSRLTYGPNSIWTGLQHIYDYGIDYYDHGPSEEIERSTPQGVESSLASESAISSAHAGSRNIYDDLVHSVDSIYRQHLARYEQSRVAPQPEVTIDRDPPRVTIDRESYEMMSHELSGAGLRPSALFESLGVSPSTRGSGPTVVESEQPGQAAVIGPNLREVIDDARAEQAATASTASTTSSAGNAVSEERSRLEQRFIEEVLERGRGPMSRYEDCAETCSGQSSG